MSVSNPQKQSLTTLKEESLTSQKEESLTTLKKECIRKKFVHSSFNGEYEVQLVSSETGMSVLLSWMDQTSESIPISFRIWNLDSVSDAWLLYMHLVDQKPSVLRLLIM